MAALVFPVKQGFDILVSDLKLLLLVRLRSGRYGPAGRGISMSELMSPKAFSWPTQLYFLPSSMKNRVNAVHPLQRRGLPSGHKPHVALPFTCSGTAPRSGGRSLFRFQQNQFPCRCLHLKPVYSVVVYHFDDAAHKTLPVLTVLPDFAARRAAVLPIRTLYSNIPKTSTLGWDFSAPAYHIYLFMESLFRISMP